MNKNENIQEGSKNNDIKPSDANKTSGKKVVQKNDFYKGIISNYQAGNKKEFFDKIKICILIFF